MPQDRTEKQIPSQEESPTGVLAVGAAGSWQVTIGEELGGEHAFTMEIDSPLVYCYFELNHLGVLASLVSLMQQQAEQSSVEKVPVKELPLGRFGGKPATFMCDSEYPDRFFLTFRGREQAFLQVTLAGAEAEDFCEAVSQTVTELAEHGYLKVPT